MNEFEELGLSRKVVDVLEELKFKEPSEIQKKTIPLVMKGKDVIGNAATGSGKTLAFASGIIEKSVPGAGIQALVLTPTRELADQISKVLRVFAKNMNLRVQEIYGGVGFDNQVRGARNSEIIIGTPGRILDHLQRKTLNLSRVKILVLDEADRMVDMGFLPDVERIISQCPRDRQTLLFSATTSQDVIRISKKYMKEPVQITVEQYVDSSKLQQYYYDAGDNQKFSLLVHLLKQEDSGIVMVFCNTRRNVDSLAMNLKRFDINAHAIHGGLEQNKRNRIMEEFHKGRADILVCTDVAARGLDIKDVTHVYNYDSPKTSEDYIHRVGRTARAGKKGMAVTILSSRDYENFRNVLRDNSLKIEKKEVPEMEKLSPLFKERGGFRPANRGFPRRNDSRGYGRGRDSGRSDDRRSGGRKESRSGGRSSERHDRHSSNFRRGHTVRN